jgi:hypothetical protein
VSRCNRALHDTRIPPCFSSRNVEGLRALDYTLRPQAAAACREPVVIAVLFVLFHKLTAAAGGARRKVESLYAFAKGNMVNYLTIVLYDYAKYLRLK